MAITCILQFNIEVILSLFKRYYAVIPRVRLNKLDRIAVNTNVAPTLKITFLGSYRPAFNIGICTNNTNRLSKEKRIPADNPFNSTQITRHYFAKPLQCKGLPGK